MKKSIVSISTCFKKDSGIGIIRISSKKNIIHRIINNMFKKKYLFPRLATFSKIFVNKKEIDEGIVIFFPKNNSYTGEDMLEIQSHGSRIIIKKIFKELVDKYNINKAKKGEFTMIAVKNKKMDFFDVERLYKLYNNRFDKKNDIKFKKKYKKKFKIINEKIFKLKLLIENRINFDTDEKKPSDIIRKIKKIIFEIKKITNINFFLKNKIKIAIIGKENVGKSTLFNILVKKNRSIVSKLPGTTTNYVKKKYKNFKTCILYDTAGINSRKNDISIKTRKENKRIIKKSDIIIHMINFFDKSNIKVKKKNVIKIYNKIDLNKKKIIDKKKYYVSCKLLFGIDKVIKKIYYLINKIKKTSIFSKNTKKMIKKINNFNKIINKKKCYSIEFLYEKVNLIHNLIINFFNFKNKKITKEIFKNFCIGK